jgi:UDP-N-acetylglucosamine 4,6-dehydratase/5-epimerase
MVETLISDKVIMVFGGTGSLGTEIVRRCLAAGASKVIAFSRDEIKHFMLRKRIADPRLETVIGDIRDVKSIDRIFCNNKVDIIYHAAAMKHVAMCEEAPLQAVETNIIGTQNVIDAAREHKVQRVITVSTDKAAYPVNVLGATKFLSERIVLNANRACGEDQVFSCVRFGNVAASRGSVVPVWVDNLLHGKPLQVTDYDVTRFIIEIPQAIGLVMKATEYAWGGEIFILKMKAFRLADMVDVTVNRTAPRLGVNPGDVKINLTGLVPGEKLHEDLINSLEAGNLYELNDMFVILRPGTDLSNYPGIKKANLKTYTSDSAPLMTKDELEQIIRNYIRDLPGTVS